MTEEMRCSRRSFNGRAARDRRTQSPIAGRRTEARRRRLDDPLLSFKLSTTNIFALASDLDVGAVEPTSWRFADKKFSTSGRLDRALV